MNLRFVDVDFTRDPRYVPGHIAAGNVEKFARYEDSAPVYPEKDWLGMADEIGDTGLDSLVTRIYNQKQEGSCVANASAQAMEIMQALQFGKENVVHLSAISLYKRIGRSAQSGAVVTDALEELEAKGILPLDDEDNKKRFKHTMPNTGFGTPYPAGWEKTAEMFKAIEWLRIESLVELVSAMFNRHSTVVGRSGHSINYTRPLNKSGKLVTKYVNSWGDWGDAGFGYDSMSMMRSASRGAFAIRAITRPEFQT